MPSRCIPLPYLRGSFVLAWVIFFSLWWYHKSTLNRLELTHGWGRRCSQLSWFWITSEFIYTKCWGLSSDFCILHYKSCILYQTPLGVSVTILSVLLCPFFSRSKLNICNALFTCRFFSWGKGGTEVKTKAVIVWTLSSLSYSQEQPWLPSANRKLIHLLEKVQACLWH